MKYKITESPIYKNFIAVPLDRKFIDYGTKTFNSFEEAKEKADQLAKAKYPEIWRDQDER